MSDDLAFALSLADAADEVTASAFTGGAVAFETKADGSPVSDADRQVEDTLRDLVREERPDDAFLGEEVGLTGAGERRWIVDGIDGTVNFVAGRPDWATEVALEVGGVVVVGVSSSPALGRRWWAAEGKGAWVIELDGGGPQRLQVSARSSLEGTRFTCIPPLEVLDQDARRLTDHLEAVAHYIPPIGHGASMVAAGEAEACVQPWGGPWDFAAWSVIVEEAGGRFSDSANEAHLDGGGPVFFTNGELHTHVLDATTRPFEPE